MTGVHCYPQRSRLSGKTIPLCWLHAGSNCFTTTANLSLRSISTQNLMSYSPICLLPVSSTNREESLCCKHDWQITCLSVNQKTEPVTVLLGFFFFIHAVSFRRENECFKSAVPSKGCCKVIFSLPEWTAWETLFRRRLRIASLCSSGCLQEKEYSNSAPTTRPGDWVWSTDRLPGWDLPDLH